MSKLARVKRLLKGFRGDERDSSGWPAEYWEDRHRALRGSLRAVGHCQVTEDANAAQYALKRERILALIHEWVPDPAGRSLLDAGCGTGVMAETYAELGFRVVGVDFSPTAIHEAHKRGAGADFRAASLHTLDLNERFDVVVLADVLMHVTADEHARAMIAALARHLKPTGVLILLDRFLAHDPTPARHVRFRTRDWCFTALADAGLVAAQHQQLELDGEGVTKDLVAVRRRHSDE
ncbi:MAG: class I SAM-dependent methyltransferase [bacterium]|nr:class I SAM-dependent methyltransferase [bacterium]